MAVDPFLDGIVVMLTGMHIPRAKSAAIRAAVEQPNAALVSALTDLQSELGRITTSVAGSVDGKWSKAYVDAMSTFASGDGADAIKNLKDTAANMADFGHESAYQVDYMNRMIIAQVVEFLIEWAITLVLAIFNPIEALIEQSFLRGLYRLILRSVILRLIALIAEHEALNIGLGAAMDVLVRWSLSLDGKTTSHGSDFLKQAVGFGAVQGAISPFVPFLGGFFAKALGSGIGRNTAKDLFKGLEHDLPEPPVPKPIAKDLAGDVGGDGARNLGRNTADDLHEPPPGGAGRFGDEPDPHGPGSGPVGPDFGRDFSDITGNLVDKTAFTGINDATRDAFRTDIGNLFARDLRGLDTDAARSVGENWADTFLNNLGRKNLAKELDTSLAGLPKDADGLRRGLSHGVADTLGTDWGRKLAFHSSMTVVEAGHQNISEGLYNLFTTGKFTTSFATGLSGAVGGRLGHVLHVNAHFLGSGLKSSALTFKNAVVGNTALSSPHLNTVPPAVFSEHTAATPLPTSSGPGTHEPGTAPGTAPGRQPGTQPETQPPPVRTGSDRSEPDATVTDDTVHLPTTDSSDFHHPAPPVPDTVPRLDPGRQSELVHGVNSELNKLGRPDLHADTDDVREHFEQLPQHRLNEPLKHQSFHIAGRIANNGDPLLMRGGGLNDDPEAVPPVPLDAQSSSSSSSAPPKQELEQEPVPQREPPPNEGTPPPRPQPRLAPLPHDQRNAWDRELQQRAHGVAPTAAKGKSREGAPGSRIAAWDTYVERFNAHQAALGPASTPGASTGTRRDLADAQRDLARWGLTDPAPLMADYRARFALPEPKEEIEPPTPLRTQQKTEEALDAEDQRSDELTPPKPKITQQPDDVRQPERPGLLPHAAPKDTGQKPLDRQPLERKADPEPLKAPTPPKAPKPPDPPLPARIGNRLVLGGMDVVEEFRSDDEGLAHIRDLVIREAGPKGWEENRERITALFSDDGIRPKVPGMLRGGRPITHVVDLGFGRTLTVALQLDGASPRSELHFKDETKKYEFEHSSDPTNAVGSLVDGRTTYLAGVQGNIAHPKASDTAALLGSREHQWALTNQRADRQISGGQTTEPGTRFHGTVQAVITHRLSGDPDNAHRHPVAYRAQVVVPTRDITDHSAIDDADADADAEEARDTLSPLPGPSTLRPPPRPTGPPRVLASRALSGSDVVTNLRLIPDDTPPAPRPPQDGGPAPDGGPATRTITDFVTSAPMQAAFGKAYGGQAHRAMNETNTWLTVELVQANLHGMTNKQPLVHELESVPGGRLEVHAFIEPLGTQAAQADTRQGPRPGRMMNPAGETAETEFHYGTETDTTQVRQDVVTWSGQLPTPGRFRGQGGTDTGQLVGGLDDTLSLGHTHNETNSRQFRFRNTLKNPAPGQGWHGQVRLRFVLHAPGSVSPSRLDAPFKGAVHETRGRFDVLIEKSETTP
ncbi:hypothetical protein GA0115240_12161, partial [Streptomyces sp. DvalAA-14]|uniref:hypothetical protein n=1 Tax=unclassified Streptomyces TaxID=2593676 RepID=UPI00081B92A3